MTVQPARSCHFPFSDPVQEIPTEIALLIHGKVLGGNYHANAAVSLSLSSGLHRIRTPSSSILGSTPAGSPIASTRALPPPNDSLEEGERIDAFWAALILNSYWIAIQESHMFLDLQHIGVDTPWPMDVIEYQLQLLPRVSSGTIRNFLESMSIEGFSTVALHAKAAVLLEQATVIGASIPDTTLGAENMVQSDTFKRLDTLIDVFKSHFPLLEGMNVGSSEAETLLVVRMMTHAATIKLHLSLSDKGNEHSRQKVLVSAQSIAVLTHNSIPTSVLKTDPIIGVSGLSPNP
ncbi:hypothetical protein H0H81_012159 [Sphagnurus paluster]|uniref:Transcription factor domain-containing protein n=1 Tax=Sphagnurus paluster TaxID=117069 RepID=A0A9P7K878_9AGAR|nr:hypothetical protein H0H81_012159 [Sphagnurus paluster]